MRSCALNTSLSHIRMSDSSGSGISYHHGDVSDDEGSVAGSVAASHASDMPDTPISKKRARPKQIQGKAWIYHGIITVDVALLHTASENDDDGPFSSLKALLLALWTSIYLQLEPKIKKLILHLAFFCNLASLMACSRDEKDSSKVQIRIRAFLRCNNTSVTALALEDCCLCRLIYFPPFPPQNCGLSICGAIFFPVHGIDAKAACRDTRCIKSACRPNQTAIGFRCSKSTNWARTARRYKRGGAAPKKRYAVTVCYEFGFSCANRIIVMTN